MTACPTRPFLPTVYTSAGRPHYCSWYVQIRRHYTVSYVAQVLSSWKLGQRPLLAAYDLERPYRAQLFVGRTRSGFPHSQPLDPLRRWRLLRLDKVRGCKVRMWDNRLRIAISFENEAFPRRCWSALRSCTGSKSCFGMFCLVFHTSMLKIIRHYRSAQPIVRRSAIMTVKIHRCKCIPHL